LPIENNWWTEKGRKVNCLVYKIETILHLFAPFFILSVSSFRLVIIFCCIYLFTRSWERLVGIATGYGLDDRGVGFRVPVGSRIFSSPRYPDRLWGPPSLLSNGFLGLLLRM
jgi:hypothetical protein